MMTEELQKRITRFLGDNKKCLVFVADPETDTIIMGYGDKLIANQIKKKDGSQDDEVKRSLVFGKSGGDARGSLLVKMSGMFYMLARNLVDKRVLRSILRSKSEKGRVVSVVGDPKEKNG